MSTSLSQLQKEIDEMLQVLEKPYWGQLSIVARLAEEVGEVARVVNHKYGDKPKKPSEAADDLEDELADVLWTIICLANIEGIELEKGIQRSIDKFKIRDKDRFNRKKH